MIKSNFIIKGKYTCANVYKEELEQHAEAQIQRLCDNEAFKDMPINIMPDSHAGKLAPIGTIAQLNISTRVLPAIVGNDIGCGLSCVEISKPNKGIEFEHLTKIIDENIPSGMDKGNKDYDTNTELEKVLSEEGYRDTKAKINFWNTVPKMCSLGSGNHFIELGKSEDNRLFLTVHCGSRNYGNAIYEWWIKRAKKQAAERGEEVPFIEGYIVGDDIEDYIKDVEIATRWASRNRRMIIERICKKMKWDMISDIMDTPHNFIKNNIAHKGAVDIEKNKPVLIATNNIEGILIGTGKENFYGPHGVGRKIARKECHNVYTASDYEKIMEENKIVAPHAGRKTLDEAPMAYNSYADIKDYIEKVIDIDCFAKPIYNYKPIK